MIQKEWSMLLMTSEVDPAILKGIEDDKNHTFLHQLNKTKRKFQKSPNNSYSDERTHMKTKH